MTEASYDTSLRGFMELSTEIEGIVPGDIAFLNLILRLLAKKIANIPARLLH